MCVGETVCACIELVVVCLSFCSSLFLSLRFVKSFLRFAPPSSRLEEVAADAGLQEKSLSELQRLADTLQEGAVQADHQHRARCPLSSPSPSPPPTSSPSLRLSLSLRVATEASYDPRKDKLSVLQLSGVAAPVQSFLAREE